jgi:dipeptidyl aminopeptidase/acylaminoacyl peptidase
LAGCAEAGATFPGKNGRLIFERLTPTDVPGDSCLTPSCRETRLGAVNPRTGRRLGPDPCDDPVECNDSSPAISPDGRSIAFTRGEYTQPPGRLDFPDRFRLAVTGLGGRRVRFVAENGFDPAWAPSGRWIAYGNSDGLHRVTPDGRRSRRVLGMPGGSLDWSSRNLIAFVRQRGLRRDIYAVRPDGTGLRRLTRGGVSRDPSWSPDGRSIAFTRFVTRGVELERRDVMVRTGSGPARRVVTRGFAPVWAPDGESIAFLRGERIWTVRIDDGEQRPVPRPGGAAGVVNMTWRAAG